MVFNSHVFILCFLPIALSGYYLLNHFGYERPARIFLVGMSFWFYGYFHPIYILLLGGSILVNYFLHCRLYAMHQKWVLIAGLLINLGILGYFKYFNFLVDNLNTLLGTLFSVWKILLPLGISFFTFQQISFLVDTYRGETERYEFSEYALFISFFPQLVAGPIVTHSEIIGQLRNPENKQPSVEWFAKGIKLFVIGMSKKLLLADRFGEVADWGFKYYYTIDSGHAILAALMFTFQLYFDFSGYCDMAKGIGYMFHIVLPTNFNSPFKSAGIIEFWKRWHITLGRFFTKYVYIPLGGNRKGKIRTCINSMIVFCLSGLWHGAGWTFVLWGVMHGIGYIIDYIGKPLFKHIPRVLRVLTTFLYVSLAFVAFRAESREMMCGMYRVIFSGDWQPLQPFLSSDVIVAAFRIFKVNVLPGADYYPLAFYLVFAFYLAFISKNSEEYVEKARYGVIDAIATAALLLFCFIGLSGVSTFLYFNF